MKKLLALVLALIMVLGLGVTAFAADAPAKINIVELTKEVAEDDELETIQTLTEFAKDLKGDNETIYLANKGDDYYFRFAEPFNDYKNVEVSATGNVTAEIVKYDPEVYEEISQIPYYIYNKETQKKVVPCNTPGTDTTVEYLDAATFNTLDVAHDNDDNKTKKGTYSFTGNPSYFVKYTSETSYNSVDGSYAAMSDIADSLNKKDTTTKYVAKTDAETTLLKVTVADNYSASYKEGTVKITATKKGGNKTVIAKLTIISDVTIFEYEAFKHAVDYGKPLTIVNGTGYSDYLTAKKGYGTDGTYKSEDLRYGKATVVSTTEFLYAKGEELTVAADKHNYVTIDEVAEGQKGVNFAFEGFKCYDEDDEELALNKAKGKVEYVTFGFLGNQVINSDFTIYVSPVDVDFFDLREFFGKKVEEEDVITYYVLEDGVKIGEFTVDYANDEIYDPVEIEIEGKAGDKLGFYTLTLDAPAAEEEGGEENPNTGAESVVGVVAAMAVISLATAAAVSLKK